MLKRNLLKFNNYNIFVISLIICSIFLYLERFIGIDHNYHPDSIHYLTNHLHFNSITERLFENPKSILSTGYYHISRALDYNYSYLIGLNFILYSLTNSMIFNLIFKNQLNHLNNSKFFLLFTVLFLDPYRLHLASHVLKETILIFLIISFLYYKNIFLRIIILVSSIVMKKNIIFYFFIFFSYEKLKKNFFTKKINKFITLIFSILFIFIFFNFKFISFFDGGIETMFDFFSDTSGGLIETLKFWHYRDMTGREYENIPNFQNIDFPIAIFLKILLWPFMIISGLFFFFTSSLLFKFLALMMIYFNIVTYYISKKTYISLGLLILLMLIALYSTTYTSYFRYSYVAIYCSITIFFKN